MTPVPSPTPDEQAAEGASIKSAGPTSLSTVEIEAVKRIPAVLSEAGFHFAAAMLRDYIAASEAALVVALERLAAVEALCDEWDNGVLYQRLAASDIRAALVGRPPTPHPTQEKP